MVDQTTRSAAAATVAARRAPRARRLLWLAATALILVAALIASIAVGARDLGLLQVFGVLTDRDSSEASVIVWSLRIPRTLIGLTVGIALGVAGALMQGHTRNPLADPGLLGVSAGAALAVVLAIQFGADTPEGYVWWAFVGAGAAAVSVYVLGSTARSGPTPISLALAGSAVTALLLALTQAVVILDVTTLDVYRFWVVGSLAGRDLEILLPLVPFFAVGLLLALANSPALNLLGLGEDVARALGLHIGRSRLIGIVSITLLVGAGTACCGPIAFVGLVVPHLARYVTGPDYRWLVPMSGLIGAVLLLVADVVGRILARPGEVQVGIVLAVVGAPFFVWLVRRRRLAAL